MSTCYRCNKELYDFNCSEEHIIPNALGGRLKSKFILCRECNSLFGNGLDKILSDKINLPTILNLKRERGEVQDIIGETKSGKKYLIDRDLKPKNEKIESYISEGKRAIVVRDEKDAKAILKQIKKRNDKIDVEEELKKIVWKDEYINEPVFFTNDILDGKAAFRAILKIAIGYYCHCMNDTWNISHLIPFLNDSDDKYVVYHYFPSEKVYVQEDGDISHILFLRGDKLEGLLYCYIELFNCHNFLIILNDSYRGFNFTKCYGYNLLKRAEINPNINLRITKEQLSEMSPPGPDDAQSRFFERLTNVYKIRGVETIIQQRNSQD